VQVRPRLTDASGRSAEFEDGAVVEVDAVVWATGYRPDYRWIDVEGVVVDGAIRHENGFTDVAGLHVLGLPWQTTRGSALLGFVAADAELLADAINATAVRPRPRGSRSDAAVL
jgi:putative flavoprotein involved in K+ transport